jgi:conjugative relaxase-like TrwC/TraI family protein
MLSTSIIKNVSDAGHYYTATDNYYTIDEGVEQSEWFGKGSQKMQLQGRVDPALFTALLKGELPSGEVIGKKVGDKIIHRAGWDLTFSAPKSISIQALIFGDKRLIEAHQKAVRVALSDIERGCSEVRIKKDQVLSYALTKNIIAALFHHDLSRAEDPQLHTHSIIMNLTERLDQQWRSMASKIGRYDKETEGAIHGFIERVRNNIRYYGKLYEMELAYQTKQLGYEIAINEKTGVFDIKGVSQDVIEYFSKRRNKIKDYMNEHGLTGAKSAEFAALHDREKKNKNDRTVLSDKWLEGIKQFGFDGTSLMNDAKERLNNPEKTIERVDDTPEKQPEIIATLKNVMDSLSQFKTTFSREELVQEASVSLMHQSVDVKTLMKTIDLLIDQKDLLVLENEHGKSYLMSQAVLKDENTIKEILGYQSKINLLSEKIEGHLIKKYGNDQEIYQALSSVFSKEQHVLVEGSHARNIVSKTISDIAKQEKLNMVIVSPNLITSKELSLDLKEQQNNSLWDKIKSLFVDTSLPHMSTNQFIKVSNTKVPHIVLVDQAHLLSASEQAKLLQWSQNTDNKNTKLIFFSEKNLLLSQKRSVDVDYLIKHGIKRVSINHQNDYFRDVIEQKDLTTLFKKIENSIIEVSDKDERLHAMANHYAKLQNQTRTYLVGENRAQVLKLNQLAHDQLKVTGKLKDGIPVNVLIPKFIPEHRRMNTNSYSIGDVIRLKITSSQSEYLTVIGQNKKENALLLKGVHDKHNNVTYWKPDSNAEVFEEKYREWSVGDRLQSHRSMKYANVVKGELFTVAGRRGTKVKLTRERGRPVYVDISKRHQQHFDYGYAGTPHQLAHVKAEHFIANLPSNSFQVDQRRFFQLFAQPKKVSLYTDQATTLLQTIEKRSGNKLPAHTILQTSTDVKKELEKFYNILEKTIERPGDNQTVLSKKAIQAVDYAMRHLSERQAGFTHKELMEVAIKEVLGDVNQKEFLEVLKTMEKAGILLRSTSNQGVLWTTQEAIKIEKEIIALTKKDAGTLRPIAANEIIEKYKNEKTLNQEQITAIKTIVQSPDRVLAIQGRAGTGKTTMMASLSDVLLSKEILKDAGYTVRGIAPTHKAVKELTARGIQSQTIDSFLMDMREPRIQQRDTFHKTILIVDEASMVSNRKMRDILSIVHTFGFRQVIPTGDSPHQLAAIEAGKPHQLIQKILDEKVIKLTDIRRQKNPILKEAVSAVYQGDVAKTFSILSDAIVEIKDEKEGSDKDIKQSYQQRVKAIAKDYVEQIQKNEDVQIITPSHEDRKAVNGEVRQQLEEKGYLSGLSHIFTVLVSKDMTATERSKAQNFKKGEIIRFTRTTGKNFLAGDYFTIQSVDSSLNVLTLQKINEKNENSESLIWPIPLSSKQLNNQVEVFKKEERTLKVGDKIVWVKSNPIEKLHSTDTGIVKQIVKDQITVIRPDKTELTFNGEDHKYRHWDHAYAITAYGAQGGTYSSILALFESYRKNLMNLKTFLVTLTRPINQLRIYTDNKVNLQDQIAANRGDKVSALEVTGEYPKSKNNNSLSSKTNKVNQINPKQVEQKFRYDLQKIKDGLAQQAEQIAIAILGQPKVRGGNFLKFGSKHGSLSVTTKGEKAGWWNDFSESNSKGRSMLSFIEKQCNMNKSDAIDYAARWLGMVPQSNEYFHKESVKKIKKGVDVSLNKTDYQKKMRHNAIKIAKESIALKDTLADIYLKKYRGIDISDMKLSNDIRFHPGIYSSINKQKLPALVSIVRDNKNEIIAVEAVYLNEKSGEKALNLTVGKQTFGSKKGGSVAITVNQKSDTVILSEGTATGLSLAKALPDVTIKSVLGIQLFALIDPETLPKKVVLALDYDGKVLRENKVIREASERLISHQKDVNFMVPSIQNKDKYDYNDVLKLKGYSSIQSDFMNAFSYKSFYQNYSPHLQINAAIKHLSPSINQQMINKILPDTTIHSNEINQFAKNMAHESKMNNQKLEQAISQTIQPKVISETTQITRNPIQIEREI